MCVNKFFKLDKFTRIEHRSLAIKSFPGLKNCEVQYRWGNPILFRQTVWDLLHAWGWDLGFKSQPKDPKVSDVGLVQHLLSEILSSRLMDWPGIEPPPKEHVWFSS